MAKQQCGNNIQVEIKGDKLMLEIDLTKENGPSKSGKTVNIGSTRGNQRIPYGDTEIVIGVNCYKYPDEE